MIRNIGYYDHIVKDEDGPERLDNVNALFADLRAYLNNNPEGSFDEYLQNIALLSAQDEIIDGDYVTLMTVHTAKGLEFPIVFLVRLNDGVFPHIRSMLEGGYGAVEEERRLAYVAITRAKQKLYLSYAGGFSYVIQSEFKPSQFIVESGNAPKYVERNWERQYGPRPEQPDYFGDEVDMDAIFGDRYEDIDEIVSDDFDNRIEEWSVGDMVDHKTLGSGVVIELEGDGIIMVNFKDHGVKSILGNHPSVTKGGKA